MNKTQIAFIIAVNNEQYYEECCYYITRLVVPESFDIDIIAVHEADSMCAAYNLAMVSSEAKYKIYLHQDVFIRNRNFLNELLEIFEKDESIGIVGMVGGNHMPKTGVAYRAWNAGSVDCREPDMAYYLVCEPGETRDTYVEAVDGLLIATQYDVPWREDLFHHFDFYDVSQSFEIRKKGYRILVPYQQIPWVIHDSSFAKMVHYDEGRRACLQEYPEFFYSENGFEFEYNEEWDTLSTGLAGQIELLMERGEWQTVATIIERYRCGKMKDSTLEKLGIMSDIMQEEMAAGVQNYFFEYLDSYQKMNEKYLRIRFLFFRMELAEGCEYDELTQGIARGEISCQAVVQFVIHAVIDKKSVLKKIMEIYRRSRKLKEAEYIGQLYTVLKDRQIPIAVTKKLGILNVQ